MLRYVILGAVCYALISPDLLASNIPKLAPFAENYVGSIQTVLKYVFAVMLALEANAALSLWAENRWMWKRDTDAWRLQDEVAVITGGSRGIGAVVVQQLVALGMKVAVLDVAPLSDGLENDESNCVFFYQCDITSPKAVHEVGEAIRSDIGSPSILINNAGIGNGGTILDISPEQLNTIFQVNLLSHWYTVKEFLPDMIAKKKGHILMTASLASFVGLAGMVDYSCTKAGLVAFYEGLTQELKHRYHSPQIKTSIVYPNWTRTRLTEPIQQRIRSTGAPVAEPEDIAKAIVRQITSNRSGQVVLGERAAAYVRALPTWLQEIIRDQQANIVTVNASTAVA